MPIQLQYSLHFILSKQHFLNQQMPGQIKINIVLEKQNDKYPLSIQQTLQTTQNNQIMLNEVILKLKRKNFNDIFQASVSYYHFSRQLFIFGFFIPRQISQKQLETSYSRYSKKIPLQALENINGELNCKLKLRKRIKTMVQMLITEQVQKFEEGQVQNDDNKRSTKQKQKTIGEVIQKVALWRKLYTGFPSQAGKPVHYQLQDAAKQINVIKKTLDDYLLQIRNGKRHGYNFHKNKDSKIGDLRSFVRQRKQKQGRN